MEDSKLQFASSLFFSLFPVFILSDSVPFVVVVVLVVVVVTRNTADGNCKC